MATAMNQHSTEAVLSSTSGTATSGYRPGFTVSHLRVYNDKSVAVFLSLQSSVGTTDGHRTCAGESLALDDITTDVFSLASTTTSTAGIVRLLALGR